MTNLLGKTLKLGKAKVIRIRCNTIRELYDVKITKITETRVYFTVLTGYRKNGKSWTVHNRVI